MIFSNSTFLNVKPSVVHIKGSSQNKIAIGFEETRQRNSPMRNTFVAGRTSHFSVDSLSSSALQLHTSCFSTGFPQTVKKKKNRSEFLQIRHLYFQAWYHFLLYQHNPREVCRCAKVGSPGVCLVPSSLRYR